MKAQFEVPVKAIAIGATFVIVAGVALHFAQKSGWIDWEVLNGHSVEITVENSDDEPYFVHVDNTGRHGPHTVVEVLGIPGGGRTPPGILVRKGEARSLGFAVGLFDSPTVHFWRVTPSDQAASDRPFSVCTFDTVTASRPFLHIHVRLRWNGRVCEVN